MTRSASKGKPFVEFIKDNFISGKSRLPTFLIRLLLRKNELEKREMQAEQFIAMACGYLNIERYRWGKSRYNVTVEDACNKELGNIIVHERVIRRIGKELRHVIPQYPQSDKIIYIDNQRYIAAAILAAGFGIISAPISLTNRRPRVRRPPWTEDGWGEPEREVRSLSDPALQGSK